MSRLRRIRHRYGFGVHSPFAFRIVNDVVRNPGRYYDYGLVSDIVEEAGMSRRIKRQALMLYRLVARIAPKSLHVCGDVAPCLVETCFLADSRLRHNRAQTPALYLCCSEKGLKEALGKWHEGDTLVAFNLAEPPADIPETLSFRGRHTLLVFRQPNLTPIIYEISF